MPNCFSQIRKYARTIRSIPVAKHSYQLIENVFQTNYSRAQDIFDLMEPEPQYTDQASALSWAAAVSYVFSIEGLFNLIYDVYLKKEIRENAGLYEHLQRLSLADKWSLASHVCYCFKDHLKTSSRGYQNLKKLVNLRNEWAHSSITPEMRTFFLREDDLAFATTAAPIHAGYEFGQEIAFVKRIKHETDTVVSELLGAVAPEFKTSFSQMLRDSAVSLDVRRVPLRGPRHDYWP